MNEPLSSDDLPDGPARTLAEIAAGVGLRVADAILDPPRREARAPLPALHRAGAAGRYVEGKLGPGVDPWRHQALALSALEAGRSVVVTTPTASGKSLVFQAHGLSVAEADGRVIVLYPVKALASDQVRSWRSAVAQAGLPAEWVAEITGDVPVPLRKDLLARARVLAMTPDVLHAWMMRSLGEREVRDFLARTRLVVLDEAHVLDAAFGSSTALLLRRLQIANDVCRVKRRLEPAPLSYVASSATMDDPLGHMERLTGQAFAHVSEADDGSPRHGRAILHLAPDPEVPDGTVAGLQRALAEDGRNPFITFCDSRKGVETLALAAGAAGVMPYRNGYEAGDRKRIESGLRDGGLKGVIATSALEMGIDMGRVTVGMNVGATATRRSMRQRIGRVGRAGPGAFALLVGERELASFGETFVDYVRGPVEPSSLYLANPYLQFQHARCLHAELAALGSRPGRGPPRGVDWPEGFAAVFEAARPGRAPPASFADVARLDTGNPHLDYALRSIGEKAFDIVTPKGKRIGSISRSNALNEAYPDGTYLHMGRRYTVSGWKPGFFAPRIVVRYGAPGLTKPILRTYVNGRVDAEGLVEGRTRGGGAAFSAEARLVVKESVVGFVRLGTKRTRVMYGGPTGSRPKSRTLRTTGTVLRLPFLDDMPVERTALAVALTERYRRAYGIAPGDIGVAATGVTLRKGSRMDVVSDALVVYDTVQGSLRLTRHLHDDLPDLVAGLLASGEASGLDPAVLDGLARWDRAVSKGSADELFRAPAGLAETEVFPAGTRAIRRVEGREDLAVTLAEPLLVRRNGVVSLCYAYGSEAGGGVAEASEVAFEGAEPDLVPWSCDEGYLGPAGPRP